MATELTSLGKPALLVIDMQRDFLDPGAPIECPGGRDAIEPIRELAELARSSGVPVIYTQEAHRAQRVDFGLELEYDEPEHCLEDGQGVDIVADLQPEPDDYVIRKRRYSGFFATDLEILLKGLGVDTLILTGVATDVCVRATAQDAQQLGYRLVVVTDCVAGTSRKAHEAALDNIGYIFGMVAPLEAVIDLMPSAEVSVMAGAGGLS